MVGLCGVRAMVTKTLSFLEVWFFPSEFLGYVLGRLVVDTHYIDIFSVWKCVFFQLPILAGHTMASYRYTCTKYYKRCT
jgi:hypothetical protein